MKKIHKILLGSLLLGATSAPAAVLLSWDTSGIAGGLTGTDVPTTLASNFNDANLQASVLTVGSGLTPWGTTDSQRFQFTGFGTNVTESMNTDAYFEFTITPASGYMITVDSVDLSLRGRAGSATATTFDIFSSVDNFTSPVASVDVPDGNVPFSVAGLGVSGISEESTPVTFRMTLGTDSTGRPWAIYGTDASADFAINGSVTAVPEPSTAAALAGLFALAALAWRRRKG